ncbi:MAG: helix-turn-helix domain-containing protein [Candidatus Lokiarchaeota archaeon]
MDPKKSVTATVKIKFPEDLWIHSIFQKFYDINMKILYFLPYDLEESIGNSIVEILHFDIELIIEEIKNHPSVLEFSILEQEEHRVKFNVKTKDPYLLNAVIRCGVLVNFPVEVEEGYAFWRLISTRERIDQFLTILENKGIKIELLKITGSDIDFDDQSSNLNIQQLKILDRAIELGFFDVPRKISLEELANDLGKSKSTLSVILRKIIKKKVMVEN